MRTPLAAALAALLFLSPARADLEIVATFGPKTPPANVAVGPDGRIFMTLHPFFGPELRLVEVMEDGSTRPYPSEAWARAPEGDGPGLAGGLGIQVDRQGILWVLDGQGPDRAGRLIGWDTRAERLHRVITLAAPITREDSFLNDFAVDRTHEAVYIADTGGPETAALIVVDLETGRARRVLEGSDVTRSEDLDMEIDGRVVTLGGGPARIGVNPITVDPQNAHVYFGAMNGRSLYRVATRDLLDESLAPDDLLRRVTRYGDKPISDGITMDGDGNVYVTDITADAIGVVRPDGSYEILYQRDDLSWPDGGAFGPDQKVYVTVNELHRSPPLNGGENGALGEFKLVAFEAVAPGQSGR